MHLVESIRESIPFRVLISPSYTEAQRTHALKQYVVRPQQLRALLAWAKAHNTYFKDVKVDDTLLASLPAESVPTSIVRISDLAEIETLPPTTALKQSAPNSTVKTTSHTAFHVQTRGWTH